MKWAKSILCVAVGIVLFLAAEVVDTQSSHVENGTLYRNPCGKGDSIYEFSAKDAKGRELKTVLTVPEQKMDEVTFREQIPAIVENLSGCILGENKSLYDVRSDLNLVTELPDHGISVTWQTSMPNVISRTGSIYPEEISPTGTKVVLTAELECGDSRETVELGVVIYPKEISWEERFYRSLQQLSQQDLESDTIILPTEFEGQPVTYRSSSHGKNSVLLLLGVVAAVCLHQKEKSDAQEKKKRREDSLAMDYQDLISKFLILSGAGYPPKAAWKKITKDMEHDESAKKSKRTEHPLFTEMKISVNQMETGIPETRVYADFGKRCGIRCYIRFASLLESCVQTGGKNLRKLLDAEMEEAFRQRADLAKKKGEEASSRLLLPLFGMLGVVMVMVAAPAFLSMG